MSAVQDSIHVRAAGPGDQDAIVGFNIAMAMETEGKELDVAVATNGVRNALVDPARARYFLAERQGEVVGQTMVTLEWSDWRNGNFWWIQSVYVRPDCRRLGVFRRLHAAVRDEAKRNAGVCGLRLYVHDTNGRAIETYARLGMSQTPYLLFEEEWSNESNRLSQS